MRQEGETTEGGTDIAGAYQGRVGNVHTRKKAAELKRSPGHVSVPAESRTDISVHVLWKRGSTTMFDIRISNLDVGSYLRTMPKKDLAKAEKDKKDLYLQACLDHNYSFTSMV